MSLRFRLISDLLYWLCCDKYSGLFSLAKYGFVDERCGVNMNGARLNYSFFWYLLLLLLWNEDCVLWVIWDLESYTFKLAGEKFTLFDWNVYPWFLLLCNDTPSNKFSIFGILRPLLSLFPIWSTSIRLSYLIFSSTSLIISLMLRAESSCKSKYAFFSN